MSTKIDKQAILEAIMKKAILPLPIINHQQVVDIIEEILTAHEGESVMQLCADGGHKEPHIWAYLYCSCGECRRGRKQIAKLMIEECLENLPQGSMIGKDAIDAVNIITDWLGKED